MRQTGEQIDQAIIDVAAGIFATHGFAQTSVQQVADAVGYSKAGLLHRFGSKEALHRAVVSEVTAAVHGVIAEAAKCEDSPDRQRRVMELVAEHILDRPGLVQMILRAFDPTTEEPGAEEIQGMGYRLVDVLDRPLSTPQERLKVVLALQLVVNAANLQGSPVDMDMHVPREQLLPMVVDLSSYVLS